MSIHQSRRRTTSRCRPQRLEPRLPFCRSDPRTSYRSRSGPCLLQGRVDGAVGHRLLGEEASLFQLRPDDRKLATVWANPFQHEEAGVKGFGDLFRLGLAQLVQHVNLKLSVHDALLLKTQGPVNDSGTADELAVDRGRL